MNSPNGYETDTVTMPLGSSDREHVVPQSAIDAILRHANLPGACCRIGKGQINRFSATFLVTAVSRTTVRKYFLKLGRDCVRQEPWSPEVEFTNLVSLWKASSRSTVLRVPEPVTFATDPPHLVTTFVSGMSASTIVKTGCTRFASRARRAAAVEACERMGDWVAEKYRLTSVPAKPQEFDTYRSFCTERIEEIRTFYGVTGTAFAEIACRWLERVGAGSLLEGCFPITTVHGRQWDCNPQNFLVTEDGPVCGVDFESVTVDHLPADPCCFRLYLEGMLDNPRYARTALQNCWRAFARQRPEPHRLLVLTYVYVLLADLAWERNPQRRRLHHESLLLKCRRRWRARRRFALLRRVFQQSDKDNVRLLLGQLS